MPKSNRSITPKSSSPKSHRQTSPARTAHKTASAPAKKSPKDGVKNGHDPKNGHKAPAKPLHKADGPTPVATPSRSITDTHEKDAKGVQAVWTGQPERQERLRDLV